MSQKKQSFQTKSAKGATARTQGKKLIDKTIKSIKDKCVLDSISEIEVHVYTDFGIVHNNIKV